MNYDIAGQICNTKKPGQLQRRAGLVENYDLTFRLQTESNTIIFYTYNFFLKSVVKKS